MCWTKNLRPHLGGENEIERNRKNNFKIFIGSHHMLQSSSKHSRYTTLARAQLLKQNVEVGRVCGLNCHKPKSSSIRKPSSPRNIIPSIADL